MNVALPVLIKERSVFYRERFSYLYGPTPYGLAGIIIELPWLLLLVAVVVPVIYFMVGFNATAPAFFFYLFVVWVFTIVFVSLGQFAAAYFSSIDVAQAVVGLVIPILFLFGGLFLREPAIPKGGNGCITSVSMPIVSLSWCAWAAIYAFVCRSYQICAGCAGYAAVLL
jgi:ABC-type multidrug transport system permease subunit